MEAKQNQQKHGIVIATPFRHSVPVQMRFNDIDVLGHLNNSVYFAFFDLGKADYFRAVRGEDVDWMKADVVIVNVNCDFMAQTLFHENIAVRTQTIKIGEKSIMLAQQLYNVDTDEVKAQSTCVMVSFDPATGCSQPLAEHWRKSIIAFEGRSFD